MLLGGGGRRRRTCSWRVTATVSGDVYLRWLSGIPKQKRRGKRTRARPGRAYEDRGRIPVGTCRASAQSLQRCSAVVAGLNPVRPGCSDVQPTASPDQDRGRGRRGGRGGKRDGPAFPSAGNPRLLPFADWVDPQFAVFLLAALPCPTCHLLPPSFLTFLALPVSFHRPISNFPSSLIFSLFFFFFHRHLSSVPPSHSCAANRQIIHPRRLCFRSPRPFSSGRGWIACCTPCHAMPCHAMPCRSLPYHSSRGRTDQDKTPRLTPAKHAADVPFRACGCTVLRVPRPPPRNNQV